jgi:fibronectin-binding autotransporter adhesin
MVRLRAARSVLHLATASVIFGSLLASNLHAETKVWTGATNSTFSDAGNWSNGLPAASLVTDKVLFNLTVYGTNPPFNPNMTANRAINGVIIGDGVIATGTLAITGGSQLQIGTGGIIKDVDSGAASIATIQVAQNQTWSNLSNTNLTMGSLSSGNRANGSILNVTYGAGGATGVITTTTLNGTSGIISPWIIFTDVAGDASYARNLTNLSGGTIGAYTAATSVTDVNAITSATTNYDLTLPGTPTLTASATGNTIRYLGDAQTIQIGDVAPSAINLTANSILNAGTGMLTIANGAGNTGGLAIGSTNELVLIAAEANIEVAAPIVANTASATSISVGGANSVNLNRIDNLGSGTLTLSNNGKPINIGATQNLTLNAVGGIITVSNVIANNAAGASTVTFNGPNVTAINVSGHTYSGGAIINPGALINIGASGNVNTFGTGTVTINGGAIRNSSTSGMTLSNNPYVFNGNFTVGNTNSANVGLSFGTGAVTLTNNVVITVSLGTGAATFSGPVSDGGNNFGITALYNVAPSVLTGGLTLAGANSFTGPLNVGDGVNPGRVNLSGASPTWQGNIILTPTGQLQLGNDSLGLSTLTINGGMLRVNGSAALTQVANIIVNENFINHNFNGSLNLGPSIITLKKDIVLTMGDPGLPVNSTTSMNGITLGPINDEGHGFGLTVQRNTAPPILGGNVTLNGINTFTGPLTILSGTASAPNVAGINSLNRSNVIILNTGTNFGFTSSPMVIAGLQDGPSGAGNTTSNTSGRDTTVAGSGNYTYGGSMSFADLGLGRNANFGLIKGGTGTQTLTGASVYTRTTGVNGGVLNLDFSGPVSTAAQTPGQDILYHNVAPGTTPVAPGSFSMGGGTLQLSGLAGATNFQRSATIGINAGGSSIVFNPAASNTVGMMTGNMTRASAGTLNVVLSGTSVAPVLDASHQLTNAANGLSTTAQTVNGILGGHVTANGSDWATADGTHTAHSAIVLLSQTDSTAVVTVPDATGISVGQTVVGPGVPTLTTVASIAGNQVTLSAATTQTAFNNLTFITSGTAGTWGSSGSDLVFYGAVPNGTPISFNTVSGSGGLPVTAGRLYHVIGSDNATTFKVTATPGATTPITNATGTLGAVTFDTLGSLTAYTGYSAFAGDGTDAATSNALVTGSAAMSAAATVNSLKIATSGAGQSLDLAGQQLKVTTANGGLLFTGADDYTIGGTAGSSITADSDTVTNVAIPVSPNPVVIPFTQTQGLIINHYGAGSLTISAPIVNGRGTLFNQNDGTTTNPVGFSSLTKSGPGTLILSGANTYSGTTHINGGILRVNSVIGAATSIGASTRDLSTTDATQVPTAIVFNGGTLQYAAGYSADSGDITGRSVTFNSNGATIDTNGNDITWSAGAFGNASVAALGGLTKTGAGKLTIANVGAYWGPTVLKGGVLSVGSAPTRPETEISFARIAGATTYTIAQLGVADTSAFYVGQTVFGSGIFQGSAIVAIDPGVSITFASQLAQSNAGASPATFAGFQGLNNGGPYASSSIGFSNEAPDNLVFDGGTLEDTAAVSHSTNRRFTLTENGGGIDASSTANGALTWSNTSPIVASGVGARTLALGGTSTGVNTMALKLVDAAGVGNTTAIAKTGPGTWALTNANTYTGGTTVSGGILLAKNTTGSATGAGAVTLDGGTLGGNGSIGGTVAAGSGAHTIAPSATLASTVKTTLTAAGLTTGSNTTLAFNLVTPDIADGSDRIKITGASALALGAGGSIAITGINGGGEPSLGWYNIIEHNGFTGSVSGITLPAVASNVAYQLDPTTDPTMIRLHRGFLGDANDDGTVNFTDFIILSQNFGQSGTWNQANFTGATVVDFNDFVVLSQNFGNTIAGGALVTDDEIAMFQSASQSFFAGTGIPEPTSLALLGIGAAGLLTRRSRKVKA